MAWAALLAPPAGSLAGWWLALGAAAELGRTLLAVGAAIGGGWAGAALCYVALRRGGQNRAPAAAWTALAFLAGLAAAPRLADLIAA